MLVDDLRALHPQQGGLEQALRRLRSQREALEADDAAVRKWATAGGSLPVHQLIEALANGRERWLSDAPLADPAVARLQRELAQLDAGTLRALADDVGAAFRRAAQARVQERERLDGATAALEAALEAARVMTRSLVAIAELAAPPAPICRG